jgi:hypothetical protein
VLGRERAPVHLVGDEDVGRDARERKVLHERLDGDALELAVVGALRPEVTSLRAGATIGEDIDEPCAAPADVGNTTRRLKWSGRAAAAMMDALQLDLRAAKEVVEPQRARMRSGGRGSRLKGRWGSSRGRFTKSSA